MSYHPSNQHCKEIITTNIHWRPNERINHQQARDWINNPTPISGNSLDMVYQVFKSAPGQAIVKEFKKASPSGCLQATT